MCELPAVNCIQALKRRLALRMRENRFLSLIQQSTGSLLNTYPIFQRNSRRVINSPSVTADTDIATNVRLTLNVHHTCT